MAHIPENGKDGYFVIALLAKLGKDIITAVLRTARLRLGLPGCPHSARARLNLGPTWPGAAQPPAPPLTRLLARALAAGFAATTNESPSGRGRHENFGRRAVNGKGVMALPPSCASPCPGSRLVSTTAFSTMALVPHHSWRSGMV